MSSDLLVPPDPFNERSIRGGFRRDQQRRGLRMRTIIERDKVLDSLTRWADGVPLLALERDQIEEWLDSCKLSPRSRANYLGGVHNFYVWCVAEGHRAHDPTARIRRPRLGRLVPRPIDDEDLRHALAVAPPRMKAWLSLAAYAGFRCHEIAGLRREDILDKRRPPVLLINSGKGGHQAVVPLNPAIMAALRVYGLPRRGYVFLNRNGRPYDPKTVSIYGAAYLRGLGIDATLHMARHFFGTTVWAMTKDMRVCQELLRHASPVTTAAYSAYDKELAAEAIAHIHERRRPTDSGDAS